MSPIKTITKQQSAHNLPLDQYFSRISKISLFY